MNQSDDKKKLLIVDDEQPNLDALKRIFFRLPCDVTTTTSPSEAAQFCKQDTFDLIISDMRMPFISGCDFFKKVSKLQPGAYKVLLSGYADFEEVIDAFNNGYIHRFLTKPWDVSAIRELLDNAPVSQTQEKTTEPAASVESPIDGLENFHGMLSNAPQMKLAWQHIEKVARAELPVFIYAPSGSGKELCAKAIHACGKRHDQPFIAVNCANFSEQLLESQLFGHVKGAFTGATSNQTGLLEAANNGTLFLDEVVEIPINLQAKLLRVLQEREFSPVGSTAVKKIDVQVISAAAFHLDKAVDAGNFRDDLRYRLCVLPIALPPLAQRKDDILPLFVHFVRQHAMRIGVPILPLSPELIDFIVEYSWPGNVRELINVTAYCCAMQHASSQAISLDLLPDEMINNPIKCSNTNNISQLGNSPITTDETISWSTITKEQMEALLETCKNNKAEVARQLGVSRMTLWRKLKQMQLATEE